MKKIHELKFSNVTDDEEFRNLPLISLQALLQSADKARREEQSIDSGGGVIWRLTFPRLEVHNLEFLCIRGRAD